MKREAIYPSRAEKQKGTALEPRWGPRAKQPDEAPTTSEAAAGATDSSTDDATVTTTTPAETVKPEPKPAVPPPSTDVMLATMMEELKKLNATVANLQAEVSSLTQQLNQRDTEIKALQARNTELIDSAKATLQAKRELENRNRPGAGTADKDDPRKQAKKPKDGGGGQ